MKKRFCALLLGIVLCLQITATAAAAGSTGASATGQVGGTSITVSIRELEPGYYLGAVWDGDELLTLFDATVGRDGVLNATVEIGKTLVTNDSLTVGISGANTNSADITYPVTLKSTGVSSSGGGGGGGGGSSNSGSSYSISVPSRITGGTVKVSPTSAKKGDTVTITVTPDSGYELDKLTVTDSKGNKLALTTKDNSKYTFTMPESKVTVSASFIAAAPANSAPQISFTDVRAGAYYYDAVAWAVEQGITVGTSAATFSPDSPCTRAQIVTFLWRAAGSPVIDVSNPFADVASGSYYYDAVAWAVDNGITVGTSATTFSPDATCTRGQAVTFLYRTAGSPAASGSNAFKDIMGGAFYTDAVQWAVNEGVTEGTSATTFSPNENCTRAQIVTFLYRYMK